MQLFYILTSQPFFRRLVQILFFPLIFVILALPPLTAEEPLPLFRLIRRLLIAKGWSLLFGVLVVLILVIWLTLDLDFGYWLQKEGEAMKFNTRLLVDKQKGGNGLATGPLPYKWFLGWRTFVHVEPNEYCAVLNGEKKISRSRRLSKSPFEPATIKHVLLYPEPRQDISVQRILSADQWPVGLTVSVKYEVVDPVRIAGLHDPIGELDQLIQGVLIDYIGKHRAEDFAGSEEYLKENVLVALQKSKTLRSFKIVEVLKAQVQQENKKIDLVRRQQLSEEEGALKKAEADVDAYITEQREWGPFRRELVKLHLEKGFEVFQKVFDGLSEAAAQGASPEQLLEIFNKLTATFSNNIGISEPAYEPAHKLPTWRTLSQRYQEERELEKLLSLIDDYQLAIKGEQVRGVDVKYGEYTIRASCLGSYPEKPPRVVVFVQNQAYPIDGMQWQPGWHLADAIRFAIKKIPYLGKRGHGDTY